MTPEQVIEYYSRNDVQKRILSLCPGREVVPVFPAGFGKRPSVIVYEKDLEEHVQKGATSFHGSVELWKNPMRLSSGSTRKEMDSLRQGWDLLIDIDSKESFDHARVVAAQLTKALRVFGVRNYSLKFSGSRGIHIGVSHRSFPEKVDYTDTVLLYPELARQVAGFLKEFVREKMADALLKHDEKLEEKMQADGGLDPYRLVEIEENWGSRHLFRVPYSLNEKTWLVSTPIREDELSRFSFKDARPDKVNANRGFLDVWKKNELNDLVIEAVEWHKEMEEKKEEKRRRKVRQLKIPKGTDVKDIKAMYKRLDSSAGVRELMKQHPSLKEITVPRQKVPAELFPPCISNIMKGLPDGRKRAVFILINFLSSCGWPASEIGDLLRDWNKKNPDPLRGVYITSHMNYFNKRGKIAPPPNCETKGYYADIRVCEPDNFCRRVRNPASYALSKARNLRRKQKPGKRKGLKK